MPEKNKCEKEKQENAAEKSDKDSWSDEQKKRRYYYDDAHGYEIYKPGDDDEED